MVAQQFKVRLTKLHGKKKAKFNVLVATRLNSAVDLQILPLEALRSSIKTKIKES